MNVIFLDIDGVVNTFQISTEPFNIKGEVKRDGFYYLLCNESSGCVSNRQSIMWLNKLCKDTNSHIVISSSWRSSNNVDECLYNSGLLKDIKILGSTPMIYSKENIRGVEIDVYLKEHPEINNYIILDDDNDFLPEQQEHLVQTSTNVGFTMNDYYKALEILND